MKIAVDFDGTIVTHEYPAIGKERPFAIDVLKRLQREEKHQIILWSVRTGELLDEAVAYCKERGLEFYAVNKNDPEEEYTPDTPRKLNVDMFIDDRDVHGMADWAYIYKKIKGEETSSFGMGEPQRVRRNPKNIILRFGEWLDKLGDEIDKRKR